MIYICKYKSPLGGITMAGSKDGLSGLWFDGQRYYCDNLERGDKQTSCCDIKELSVFEETAAWLDIYFSGKCPDFTPKLVYDTTPFRKTVWQIMLGIPYGRTMTYGEIAGQIAKLNMCGDASGNSVIANHSVKSDRAYSQAVGGAVGHNSISIIIPCHRVVGSNGSLTGYAGGIERKIQLLKLEKADMSGLFMPKKGTAL